MRFVVDTSAMIAIRRREPERDAFDAALTSGQPTMSVGTLTELTLVWQASFGRHKLPDLDLALASYGIDVEAVTSADTLIIRHAIEAYARGRGAPPACLNFGDLFAYALAKRLNLPLLFKGDDFARTDVRRAIPAN